jgi:hypothetical protein
MGNPQDPWHQADRDEADRRRNASQDFSSLQASVSHYLPL